MRKLLLAVLLLCLSASAQIVPGGGSAPGGTITGQIQTATGGPIKSGTLTFSLSQPAIVSNSASLATTQVACYTSAAGNIVGVPDPLALPTLSANLATGTLPAGTYYVQFFYTSPSGTSVASPELAFNLTAQGTLNINPPGLQPASATGFGVAIGATSGSELIQGTVSGFTQFQQSQPLLAGGPAPMINTSSCNLYFSDQLIPTGTYYTVNLINKNASQVAGFPQTWCTYGGGGGVINVSQGAPTGNCNVSGVFYPTPIFANSLTGLSQSIAGPIAFTGPVNFAIATVSGNVNFAGTNTFLGTNNFTGTNTFSSINNFSGTNTFSGTNAFTGTNTFTGITVATLTASLITTPPGIGLAINSATPLTGSTPGLPTTISGGSASAGGSTLGGALILGAGGSTGAAPPATIQLLSKIGQYQGIATYGNGVPAEFAGVDLGGQTAAITTTTLYAVPSYVFGPTQYRLSWDAKVTTVATTSSTLGPLTIVYTDADGTVQTITASAQVAAGTIATSSGGNTTATVLLGMPILLNVQLGSNVTYAFAYASNSANQMTYNLHIRLEAE